MTDSNDKPTDEQTPPWGSDEDFDPARAWKLITDLRADKATLQTERDEARTERDTLQTERETREAEATSATDRATKAERDLFVERALRKHAVPDDLVDFVRGDTEEEILNAAERLSKVAAPKAPAEDPEEKPADKPEEPQLPGRPKPKLTPGHGGGEGTKNDLDAIVKSVRG